MWRSPWPRFVLTCGTLAWTASLLAQDTDIVRVDKRTAIPIVFERDGKMQKEDWDGSLPEPKVIPLEKAEVDRMTAVLKRAMAKYPPEILRKHLKRVYVAKDITVDNYSYGGTYSGETLYLANGGPQNGFDDSYLEQTFHHEFSSVLMYAKGSLFSERRWERLNPKGFRYIGYDKVWSNDPSVSIEPSPSLYEKGFWSSYATVSVEEDFNTMAENIFAGGPDFWKAVDRYPRLKAKMKEAVRFYGMLDVHFTEWGFRQYAKRGRPPEASHS